MPAKLEETVPLTSVIYGTTTGVLTQMQVSNAPGVAFHLLFDGSNWLEVSEANPRLQLMFQLAMIAVRDGKQVAWEWETPGSGKFIRALTVFA